MSADDADDRSEGAGDGDGSDDPTPTERLERGAGRAISEFDEGVVDLLSWLLETETRARIYVYLREDPESTSEEVADGTGLYPSTVREALANLHDEGKVTRSKRENGGAGNNPYEYRAIPPSDLVENAVERVQESLNAVVNLDRALGRDPAPDEADGDHDGDPVTITVEDAEADDDHDHEADDETE